METGQFLEVMTYLASNYKNYDGSPFGFTQQEIENWYGLLGRTDLQTFKYAVREHILQNEKPPTIASINKMIKQVLEQATQAHDVLIDEQVEFIVNRATKKHSPTYDPQNWKALIGYTYGAEVQKVAESFMNDIKSSTVENVGHIKYNLKQSLMLLRNRELATRHLALTKTGYKSLETRFKEEQIAIQMEGFENA